MSRVSKLFFWVPNTITALNLVSGCLSVFFAVDGQLGWASVFIFAAATFDFCDGFSARLLKAYSSIGKELDSLADLVSFGLAPAAIVFTMIELTLFGKNQLIQEIDGTASQWILLFSSLVIPVAGAFRLANRTIPRNANPVKRYVFCISWSYPGTGNKQVNSSANPE